MAKHLYSLLALLWLVSSANAAELVNRVLATVNDQIITLQEAQDRLQLIVNAGNLPPEAAQDKRLQESSLRSLIDEKIKQTTAEKAGIQISKQDIAQGFAKLAQQNNFSPDEFSQMLDKQGVNRETLNRQIAADLAWRRYVEMRLVPQVKISPSEVKQQLSRMQNQIGKTEYNVAEIFLPVDQGADEATIQQRSSAIYQELLKGANFATLARNFSAGSAAAQGGLLGWTQEQQLAPEVAKALSEMQPNQLSSPIRSLRGYHILFLRQTRTLTAENLPNETQLTDALGNQQIDLLQRRTLRDLRLAAVIDVRQ